MGKDDPLNFEDKKKYIDKYKNYQKKTGQEMQLIAKGKMKILMLLFDNNDWWICNKPLEKVNIYCKICNMQLKIKDLYIFYCSWRYGRQMEISLH